MEKWMSQIGELIDLSNWLQRAASWIPNLFTSLIIMAFFWILWQGAKRAAASVIRRAELDPTAANFIQTIIKFTLLTIGIVTALGKIGINTASILTSLGVAGLTIGFAAKDALSNMISGLFIFWDRPFVIGDLVEVGGEYGRVESITLRSTRVVTPDGRMLAVPNSTVVNTTVASYTNFPHLRLDIPFTVGVNENLDNVRKTALSICDGNDLLMDTPVREVVVTQLNDYNIALRLQVWIDDETRHIAIRNQLRELLFEALRHAQIDMPYETFALTPLEIKQSTS